MLQETKICYPSTTPNYLHIARRWCVYVGPWWHEGGPKSKQKITMGLGKWARVLPTYYLESHALLQILRVLVAVLFPGLPISKSIGYIFSWSEMKISGSSCPFGITLRTRCFYYSDKWALLKYSRCWKWRAAREWLASMGGGVHSLLDPDLVPYCVDSDSLAIDLPRYRQNLVWGHPWE